MRVKVNIESNSSSDDMGDAVERWLEGGGVVTEGFVVVVVISALRVWSGDWGRGGWQNSVWDTVKRARRVCKVTLLQFHIEFTYSQLL